jgi:hypothetical protein
LAEAKPFLFQPLGLFSIPARSLKGKLVIPEDCQASWMSNRALSFYNKAADKSVLDVRNVAFSFQKSFKASHNVTNDFRKVD